MLPTKEPGLKTPERKVGAHTEELVQMAEAEVKQMLLKKCLCDYNHVHQPGWMQISHDRHKYSILRKV